MKHLSILLRSQETRDQCREVRIHLYIATKKHFDFECANVRQFVCVCSFQFPPSPLLLTALGWHIPSCTWGHLCWWSLSTGFLRKIRWMPSTAGHQSTIESLSSKSWSLTVGPSQLLRSQCRWGNRCTSSKFLFVGHCSGKDGICKRWGALQSEDIRTLSELNSKC